MTKMRSERKRKKRLWPKVLSVMLLLLFAGAGYMYYLFEWKTYDIADEELYSIAATPYETNLSERRGWDNLEEEGISESEVINVYEQTLEDLKQTTNRRVAEVANRALAEYQEQDSAGSMSIPYLYQKYIEAADQIERQLDTAFNDIHQQMVHDLKQVGGNTGEAEAMREEYEAYKQQLRRQIMDEAGVGF